MPFTAEEIALLRGGPEGIAKWNELRKTREEAPDLNHIELGKVNLSGANLSGVNLRWANLEETNLEEANLEKADLLGARLSRARLIMTNLTGASLFKATLGRAYLIGVKMEKADLRGADLTEVELFMANLRGANLSKADLRGANLNVADLQGVNLSGANLSGANLSEAYLSRVGLSGVDLSGVKLHSAVIESREQWAKLRDRIRRLFAWPTVRALGALQVLTKASYFMLAFVPILTGVWQVVHVWTGHAQRQTEAAVRHLDDRLAKITPTDEQEAQAVADVRAAADKAQAVVDSLHPHLPSAWAWAFFAALAAAAGHFVYQVFCPDLLKAKSRDEHVSAEAGSFTHDAPNRDDRLTRALTSLRELAEQVPEQRHPNLVRRHGQVVWIPSELSQFHSAPEPAGGMTTVGEEAGITPPKTTVQAGLMMVAIEEGASAEYELQGRRQRPAAVVAFVLYAIAAALILWLVLGQSWAIIRAAWLS